MAVWVNRTGKQGQFERDFFESSSIYYTRDGFDFDLAKASKEEILLRLNQIIEGAARQTISNTWSQIDIFAHRMCIGDIVIVPKKNSRLISVGLVTGCYQYSPKEVPHKRHARTIRFIAHDVDTTAFPQDLKYSLRAYRTVFTIRQEKELINELRKMGITEL